MRNFRDLGGNLAFLSANNFFWQVAAAGPDAARTRLWRDLGRPESSLLGVQYRGNDDGKLQRPYIVRSATTAPWFWAGTGLGDGATFGQELGGYGIEIDATMPSSPPGTTVLAEIPDLFGPGLTAQMTYYETPQGAKVFAGGAIDFGGSATLPTVRRMLENLWARLARALESPACCGSASSSPRTPTSSARCSMRRSTGIRRRSGCRPSSSSRTRR